MNIHAANPPGPAESSSQEGAAKTARFRATTRGEVGVERRQRGNPEFGSRWVLGAEQPVGLWGRALACLPAPAPGDRLVSWVTALFLFIGTLSGLIIRSLPRLLLLAIAGK